MQVICKYHIILYKGLAHPWILVSKGCSGTSLLWVPRIPTDDCTSGLSWQMLCIMQPSLVTAGRA